MFYSRFRLMPLLFLCAFPLVAGEDAQTVTGKADFPDITLQNQNGEDVRFYTDLIKDKVVAINFIFTNCPTICPPMGVNFGKLQQMLGNHTAQNIQLISVSVDPATDTPDRLKEWAAQFGAAPGWTLLTGRKYDVDKVLKAMNAFSADITSHSPMVLIGNEATGEWTRVSGLGAPKHLEAAIQKVKGGNP